MIGPETPRASGASRNADAQSWRKRITVAVATLLLAAGFVFGSASTATAAPTFTNDHMTAPCRGEAPGFCPNSSHEQPGEEGSAEEESAGQSKDQPTTKQSNEQLVDRRTNEQPAPRS